MWFIFNRNQLGKNLISINSILNALLNIHFSIQVYKRGFWVSSVVHKYLWNILFIINAHQTKMFNNFSKLWGVFFFLNIFISSKNTEK